MYNNFKIIVWSPAGRQRYLEILTKYIINEPIIDEYHLCINTLNSEDIEWMNQLAQQHSKIHIKQLPNNIRPNGNSTIGWFFREHNDPKTIYIRLDDDIVWLENNFFTKLVEARINNPEHLFILPNIINNALIDHIHMRKGILGFHNLVKYHCDCDTGWKSGQFAEHKHRTLITNIIKNDLNKYKFDKWILNWYERISINCLCYFGDDYKVPANEEKFLTEHLTKIKNKYNCVIGEILCSHFSFYTQAKHMSSTNILQLYHELANDRFNNSNQTN